MEHDGLPLCKNCHRNHLGQGKGGFGKAVPVRANLPVSPDRKKEALPDDEDDEELVRRLTGINIRPRARAQDTPNRSPSPGPPRPVNPTPATALAPARSSELTQESARSPGDWSHISNLDDLVASSSEIPRIQPRSSAIKQQVDDVYSSVGESRGSVDRDNASSKDSVPLRVPSTPPPKPASLRATAPAAATPTTVRAPLPDTFQTPPSAPSTSSIRSDGLPTPVRRIPGSQTSNGNSYKTAPALSPSAALSHQYSSPTSSGSPNRFNNSIHSGTPLCARCSKPVYHAEQVIAASGNRVWHRPCLRCDVCSRTLQKGQLEEGPTTLAAAGTPAPPLADNNAGHACNIYCRVCYKKYFGPRGIGVGMSFPVQ